MGIGDGFAFGGGFTLLFSLIFVLILLTFLVNLVCAIRQWRQNNRSPRLTTEAQVVSRRSDVTWHHHTSHGGMGTDMGMHTTSSTTYYVTFQMPSGDRMELSVPAREYGQLAEGDLGQLSFQGTRYLGFQRRSAS